MDKTSKRIKTIIIENDLRYISSLKIMLSELPELDVLGVAIDVKSAVDLINKCQPNLVFLDIELNGGTGFDVISQFTEITFDVIFTTAFEGYAIDALKISAVDYLLKPFGVIQIREAVERMRKKNSRQSVKLLANELYIENNQEKTIALPTHDGINYLVLADIVYCKADSNYTLFYTRNNKEIMVSTPLKKYDDMLTKMDFFRIHQSYLINLNYVKKYIKNNGGDVLLTNDIVIPVSRRKKEALLALLKQKSIG
jgi:two-component system LytT family response regulator